MEFKKLETEAALWLMNDLRTRAEDLKSFSKHIELEIAEKKVKPADEERQRVISIHAALEYEILKQAVEQLETDIKEQNFNY